MITQYDAAYQPIGPPFSHLGFDASGWGLSYDAVYKSPTVLQVSGVPSNALTGEPEFQYGRRLLVKGCNLGTKTGYISGVDTTTSAGNTRITVTLDDGSALINESITINLGLGLLSAANTAPVIMKALADLRSIRGNGVVQMLCRATIGDQGGGLFAWMSGDQSANVTNDPSMGVYIPPANSPTGSTGCWVRQFDPAQGVSIAWFGGVSQNSDISANLQAAILFCSKLSVNAAVTIPAGKYRITKSINCYGYYHSGNGYNLQIRGAGLYRTILTSNLTEAYPAFDLTDNKRANIKDFQIITDPASLEYCQFFCAETGPARANGITFDSILSYVNGSPVNVVANFVAVSADQLKINRSSFTSYKGKAFVSTYSNDFNVPSKFYSPTPQDSDQTYMVLSQSEFVGSNDCAVYITFMDHIQNFGVYYAVLGTTPTDIIRFDVPRNMIFSGDIHTENQSSATGVRIFNATDVSGELNGSIYIDVRGALQTDLPDGILFGGNAWYRGKTNAFVYDSCWMFENSGSKPPQVEINEVGSHNNSKFFKNISNLSGAYRPQGLTLNGVSDRASLGDIVKYYAGIRGGRKDGIPWESCAYAVYYPGSTTAVGRPVSALGDSSASRTFSNTTNGTIQTNWFSFTTKTVQVTSLAKGSWVQANGYTPSPMGRLLITLKNNLTGSNTADLRMRLAGVVIFTASGLTAPSASSNGIVVEVYFVTTNAGGSAIHTRVTAGTSVIYNNYTDLGSAVTTSSDVSLNFDQQSTTQADPFTAYVCQFFNE